MGNWQLDPYHTQVEFSAKHGRMVVSEEIQITIEIEVVEQPQAAEATGN